VLKPWRHVLDAANWEPLVGKVLDRLERTLRNTPVRPDKQDLQPFKDFLIWIDLAPLDGLAQVLESAFFPQWHAALRAWLRDPECDYGEVVQWYQGCRALIPNVLYEHPSSEKSSVRRHLDQGLEFMKQLMSTGGQEDAEASPASPTSAPKSPKGEGVEDTAGLGAPDAEEVSMSLSEYIAEVAGEQGLVFRPKGRTNSLGRQVYQLGSVSICLDKNMVLLAPKDGSDKWQPASMDELLQLAKKASRKS